MLCVLAKLSDEATEKLVAIQRIGFPDGEQFKPLHGHITLVSYEGDDEAGFIRSCKELLKGVRTFDVLYKTIDLFDDPALIVAKPEKSEDLEDLHQRIAREHNDTLNQWTKTGCWNPHTSLYTAPNSDIHEIYRKMSEAFVPFPAAVCSIEFSRVLEEGYDIVDTLDLGSR